MDAELHAILDHMFGGGDYTAKVNTFGTYYVGDPQGAGSQVGSRVSIANDGTKWASASNGVTSNLATISLTSQPTATYWAEFDASSGGNLLWSTQLPIAPSSGTIPIGGVQFRLF